MRRLALLVSATAVGLAACSGSAALPPEVTPAVSAAPPATPPTFATCAEPREYASQSYPPLDPLPAPGAMPQGSTMEEIVARGRLTVGVSGDTLLFGARNPLSGEIEGFDIDMLKEVAKAIFGEGGEDRIEYRVITYADRLPRLESGDVDIVAHTMTINCNRWKRIAFSSVYFLAGQKVLVNQADGFDSVDELAAAGATVCAPNGSTNIDQIRAYEDDGVVVLGTDDISDCLVAMQQGDADAITGDDTVLAGFAAQDPNTVVVGEPFSEEPYGLGMSGAEASVDLVQFVNAVLEEIRANGRYQEIVQRWLIDTGALQTVTPVPPPDHSRPLP